MSSINSDYMSQMVLQSLNRTNSDMTQAMQRLSSGKRINSASDDAAGLSIASKLRAQVKGLNAAIKNSSDAMAMVGTIEGALQEGTKILQRMRQLAVQAASDTNTGTDRAYLQDEVNQLATEMNRISNNTEFNSQKLLDGTFTDKVIQIGASGGQVLRLGVAATDSGTLGTYQIKSTNESLASSVNTHALAVSGLDALVTASADYVVNGSFGTVTATVDAGADARDVASAFNIISGTTGVIADSLTRGRLSFNAAATFTFTLQGKSSSASTVTATITSTSDVTAIKDAINAVSGSTGITAALTTDKSGINIVQEEGYDVIVGDMSGGTAFLQSMDRDEVLDGNQRTLVSGSTDSNALLGQVTLSSHQAFTITPGVATNHFSANTSEQSSSISNIASVSLVSKTGATNSLAVIDGALAMISEIRSSMGAANNRLKSTVDNLSNIAVNAQSSLSKIEDANFAEETSALTKAQILQQASTAMLAQANKGKQGMLQLIQGL
jgi:flagellin